MVTTEEYLSKLAGGVVVPASGVCAFAVDDGYGLSGLSGELRGGEGGVRAWDGKGSGRSG